MTTISITLPSIYPNALDRTIANLISATKKARLEIIVVSPFTVAPAMWGNGTEVGGKILWVEDKVKSGNIAAHFEGAKYATGDFIFAWVDDHRLVDGWDEKALANFEGNMKRNFDVKPYVLGLRQISAQSHIGTVFGIYYPYFPFIRRADLELIGGWLDPEFKVGFGDCDLGLRVWFNRGLCEWSEEMLIGVMPDDSANKEPINASGMSDKLEKDMARFVERWGPIHGEGWKTETLRGFNIDLPIALMKYQYTYYRNKDGTA